MVFKHFNYRPTGRLNYNYLPQIIFYWFIIQKQLNKSPICRLGNFRECLRKLLFFGLVSMKEENCSIHINMYFPFWNSPHPILVSTLGLAHHFNVCVSVSVCVCMVCVCVCVSVSVLVIHKSNNPNKLSLLHIFATFTIPQQQERNTIAAAIIAQFFRFLLLLLLFHLSPNTTVLPYSLNKKKHVAAAF